MMISPEVYVSMIEDKSYENLVKERNKIIRKIQMYEKGKDNNSKFIMNPSPEVVYQCNNMYLIEITQLLNDTFNNKINN